MSATILHHVLGFVPHAYKIYSDCAGYLPRGFRCVLMNGSAGLRWEGFRWTR